MIRAMIRRMQINLRTVNFTRQKQERQIRRIGRTVLFVSAQTAVSDANIAAQREDEGRRTASGATYLDLICTPVPPSTSRLSSPFTFFFELFEVFQLRLASRS